MKATTETRELFTLDNGGVLLRGTYHRPDNANAPDGARNRLGVLFLNSLSVPRASTGDSAVYWADAFAGSGYPSFRVDLPGLGDSTGIIPTELLDYMNVGGYASIASAKVKELVRHFDLSGVVIVGHCAGAITGLHAAASCTECKGLILMDPYFHLTKALRPKARVELSDWARRSKLGGILSNVYDLARDLRLLLFKNRPPRNANFSLLNCWKKVASSGLPILIFKAPGLKTMGTKPRQGEFDYLEHVLKIAGQKKRIAVQFIEDADHSFANRLGRAAVRGHAETWLATQFPVRGAGKAVEACTAQSFRESSTEYSGHAHRFPRKVEVNSHI